MKLAEDLGRSLVTEEQSQLLLCVMGRVPRGLEASLVNVLIKCNAMAQPQKHCDCSQHRCSLSFPQISPGEPARSLACRRCFSDPWDVLH